MDEETLALLRRIEQVLSDHNADRLDHKECERCDWDFGEKHGGTLDAVPGNAFQYHYRS